MSAAQAAAATVATKVSYVNRFFVQPVCRLINRTEAHSQAKLKNIHPKAAYWIENHEVNGSDAAAISSRLFLQQQSQLIHYRVVRCVAEGRHLFSGEYFKHYSWGKGLQDLRFVTQALLMFIVAVMVGRRGVFPPIHPDSPLAFALENKVNPNY